MEGGEQFRKHHVTSCMALHQGPHGESLVAGRLLGQRRNGMRHRPKPGVRVGRKPPQESALLEFEEEEMQTTSYLILSNNI